MPDEVEACLGRRMALLRPNRSVVDSRFLLYFYLSPTFQRTIATHTIHGATVPRIGLATMPNWQVEIPGLSVQHAIAEILGALDDKISANDRAIGKLEELSVAEYRRELGRGVRLVEVDSIAEFHNRRRIPLSAKQRQERLGDVPYYGAAGCIGSVDAAIFNEPLVLVGEDGSVIRGDGKPVVQYIWGPAWVNNHAHVLTGRSVPTELLRIGIECANVAHLVTGAVQPKLSMGKLKSLTISLPVEHSLLDISLTRLAASVRGLSDENRRLASTRDELLPLLMSGRIRVKDATRVVEEVF